MAERRRSPRQRSFLRGCIYFNQRRGAVDCLIRDVSSDGARVIFSDAVSVPDIVELHIPQKERTLRARVQWRHGDEVGLAFTDAPAMSSAPAPAEAGEMAQRVGKLEAEVAALRRLLRRLKSELPGADEDAA